MTLDEAIAHCLEVAEKKEDEVNNRPHLFDSQQEMDDCANCAAEHLQLAEWLKELKKFREGRKRGKWIKKTKTIELNGAIVYDSVWICPNCGTVYDGGVASNLVNYCYCCGAKMSGGEQE